MVNVSFSRFSAVDRKTNSSCGNQQRPSWRNLFLIIPVLAVLGLALQGNVARATVLVDDFSEPQVIATEGVTLSVPFSGVVPQTGQGTKGGLLQAIGGSRDINATLATGDAFDNLRAIINGIAYSHAQDPSVTGSSEVVWDGDTDASVIDFVGLGGIDMSEAGTQDAMEIRIRRADLNAVIALEMYTDSTHSSIFTVNFTSTQLETIIVVPFTSFTQTGAVGPVDFTNVGAVRLFVDGTGTVALDVQVQLIQTTSTVTADKSATIVSGGANGLDANDIIEYTVTVHNNSVVDISGVDFTDTVDANTTLLCNAPDAPVLPAGASLTLCDSVAGTITVNTGPTLIPAGGTADIVFRVQVNDPVPANTPEICNQGSVDFGSLVGVLTDDTATFAIPNDPTCLDLNGQVTIIKQTVPAGLPQSFDFTGDLGAFSLVHGASQTQSLPAGAYNVVETALANWTLTNLVCVDSITGDSTVDIPNATSTINLERGESVTCTYTNTAANGTLIIRKLTNPAGSPQAFTFNPSWKAAFNLLDTQTNSTSVTPGNGYNVNETVPAGWTQSSVACDDGSPVSNIDVSPGETVTCTFTNTQDATIIVRKNTDPAGSAQSFTFSPSWKGSFNLVDGGADTTNNISAGNYNVSEALPAGWLQTAASCVGSINATPQSPSSFNVLAGETMTCTFDNTQQGTLIVVKQTIPAGLTQSFTFNPSWKANFNLSDGGSDSTLVNPAIYNVSETVPANWSQTSATCDDGSPVNAIDVAAGETVTCTFVNTAANGTIIVEKLTNPSGSPQSFAFNSSWNGAFNLTDTQTNSASVTPGNGYNVSEILPAGWTQTSALCDDGSPINNIDVAPGETVRCTFINTQDATIIVRKNTAPAGSPQSFAFTPSWKGGFNLTDGGSDTSTGLTAGAFTVSESLPAGWTQTSASCVGDINATPQSPSGFNVLAGETMTCTFDNTQQSTLIIQKQTIPSGLTQSFTFTPDWKGNFNLSDGGSDSTTVAAGIYAVSETVPANWSQTSATCDDGSPVNAIDVAAGETVTCTFVNTAANGTIIVEKLTDPSGSPQSFAFNSSWNGAFNLTDTQTNSASVTPGNGYNVSETVPAGWTQTSALCDDGSPINNIDVAPGETVRCTFINTQDATIIVRKNTAPAGSPQSFAFTPSWKGGFNLTDGGSDTTTGLTAGAFTVSESLPAGWTQTSASCVGDINATPQSPSGFNVLAGETMTCTFDNTQQSTLIIQKQTIPSGLTQSFTFTPDWKGNFNLSDGGSDSTTVAAGIYAVSETVPANWSQTSATCDDGSPVNAIDVAAGETVTCTFVNTAANGTIIVEKLTNPSGSPQSFAFNPSWKAAFNLLDTQTNSTSVTPGNGYNVNETVPAGWTQSSALCDDGSPISNIDVAPGETVRCTFTNTQDATIIVNKSTFPAGSAQSFTFTPSWKGGFNLTDGGSDTSNGLTPGTFNVSEALPAGWAQTLASCEGSINATPQSPTSFNVLAGETMTCSFVNTQGGTIIVEKQTDPDGSLDNFTFTGDAAGTIQDNGQIVVGGLAPGVYTSTETPTAGWDLTSISCDDADSIGVVGTGVTTFNLQAGETVTCVYNNRQRGTIIVEKQTDPDGSLDNFSFTGDAAGTIQDNGTIVVGNLVPGTYTSVETALAGWDLTGISCDDADSTGSVATSTATFNLQAGETVRCTFNNTQRGTIIVEKQTDPANAPDSFSFTGDAAGTIQDNGTIVVGNLVPGTYTSVETALAGWDLTGISCDDADSTGSVATSTATFNLQAGETVRCTFNNTQRGTIIVEKQTDPANAPDSFSFTGDATGTIQDNGTIVVGNLVPGTYTSVETALAGWQLTGISCDDADSSGSLGTSTANFNLQAGETVRCTFTNTKLGSITVEKQTDPANAPDSFVFTGDAAGSIVDNGTIVVGNLLPGSYTSVESITAGWDLTDITCNDLDSSGDTGTRTASFELQAGEDVTCVFTNTQGGTIIVEKQTDPDGSVENFTFTGDAAGTIQDNGQIVVNGLAPGVYTSTETPVAGWDLTDISCDDGDSVGVTATGVTTFNLQAGETITCVYTNTQRGTIIVEKQTDPANAPDNFVFTGDAAGTIQDNGTIVVNDLVPGNYSSVETLQTGWDVTGITCDDADSTGDVGNRTANFILQAGETVRCVFTNTQRGTIIVEKQTDPDGAPGNFTFTGDAAGTIQDNGQIMVNNLIPGTYTSVETAQANWELDGIVCDDADSTVDVPTATATFELQPGETITCIFTNNLLSPDLEITKTDGGLQFVDEGDILEYFLNYSNQSLIDATNVTLTETVPQYTTFSSIGSTPGWSCANGAPAGTICTLNVGTLVGGDSGQAIFAVVVDNITVPDPITGLCPDPNIAFFLDNEATVESDEGDSDSADNTGAENTPVVTNCTPALPIPTLNGFGIWAFILMMLSFGGLELRRRRFFN